MKKLLLILCLTTATINAMQQAEANAYIAALRGINEQAAALAMQKNPTPDEAGRLIAQEESVRERYKNLGLDDHTLHSTHAPTAATIHDLSTSIGQYIAMIENKMDRVQ